MAMYYYNDVLLPEIPADVLAEYPYYHIVVWDNPYLGRTFNMDFTKAPQFVEPIPNEGDGCFYVWTEGTDHTVRMYFYLENDKWTFSTQASIKEVGEHHTKLDDGIWWLPEYEDYMRMCYANHDIHYVDSSTGEISTEIYLAASEPVLYEPADYWYRGAKFPELRPDILETHPYCFIKYHYEAATDTTEKVEQYIAYYATTRWYATTTDTGYTVQPVDTSVVYKTSICNVFTDELGFVTKEWLAVTDVDGTTAIEVVARYNVDANWIYWSNTDIPIGTVDATELYIEATKPIGYVERGNSYYSGTLLPDYPEELLVEKQYALLYKMYMAFDLGSELIENTAYMLMMTDNKCYITSAGDELISPIGTMYYAEVYPDLLNMFGESAVVEGENSMPFGRDDSDPSFITDASIIWSNYDIPIDSVDGTEIYLAASEPVSADKKYSITAKTLFDFSTEAKRIGSITSALLPAEMIDIFKTAVAPPDDTGVKTAEEGLF